jgi:hypothetical protein
LEIRFFTFTFWLVSKAEFYSINFFHTESSRKIYRFSRFRCCIGYCVDLVVAVTRNDSQRLLRWIQMPLIFEKVFCFTKVASRATGQVNVYQNSWNKNAYQKFVLMCIFVIWCLSSSQTRQLNKLLTFVLYVASNALTFCLSCFAVD